MRQIWIVLLAAGLSLSSQALADDAKWISHYNGVDGWFAFRGPQRAMDLNPRDFGLSHPVQVESLKIWWYGGMGSWTDSVYTFRIYGSDGQTLLWESGNLVAPRSYWVYYGLPVPVRIDSGRFWIATTHRSVNPYAHPYTNVDNSSPSHSYYGSPGNWTLDNVGELCFHAYVREVQTGAGEGRWLGPTSRPAGPTLLPGVVRVSAGEKAVLLDALGRKAKDLESGDNDISQLEPGAYFVVSRYGTAKLVVVR